jgi:hypothetical protein
METQNISAQLFVKQLPQAQLASFDGAKTDYNTNYLNTSVNYPESDRNIEDAFQKQLDLSEYYKSVQVFDKMKQVFDTNEGTFNTTSEVVPDKDLKKNPFKGPIMPVGPRDTVFDEPNDSLVNKTKESFGNIHTKYSKESLSWNPFKDLNIFKNFRDLITNNLHFCFIIIILIIILVVL